MCAAQYLMYVIQRSLGPQSRCPGRQELKLGRGSCRVDSPVYWWLGSLSLVHMHVHAPGPASLNELSRIACLQVV